MKSRLIIFSIIMGVALGLFPVLVFSSAFNPVITLVNPPKGDADGSRGKIPKAVKEINAKLKEKELLTKKLGGKIIHNDFITYTSRKDKKKTIVELTINMSEYKKRNLTTQQNIMGIVLNGINDSSISRMNKTKLYNEISSLDTVSANLVRQLSEDARADFYKGYSYIKPFNGIIGTFLGVVAILIFMLLGFTAIFDIAYMTLPFAEFALSKADPSKKPRFVSMEAWYAVKERETSAGQTYKNPIGVYIKVKAKQYIIISICLLYLVSGKLFVLVSHWLDLFQGVVK